MNQELEKPDLTSQKEDQQKTPETIVLCSGLKLTYLNFTAKQFHLHHEPPGDMIQIHYCRSGHMVLQPKNGTASYLEPGGFSVHTLKAGQNTTMIFPAGLYDGLVISIDVQEAAKNPPMLLENADLLPKLLHAKFCKNNAVTSFSGCAETDAIFSLFYDQPETVRFSYQKIKTAELLLYLLKTESDPCCGLTECRSEQADLIREIHDYLLEHMDQKLTIQDLSKKYLINPTTLKNTFKSVYGISLASHMKEHRMGYAAEMLRNTSLSISEIAQRVGYDSQSRFSEAFKAFYQILPTEYRRQRSFRHSLPAHETFTMQQKPEETSKRRPL